MSKEWKNTAMPIFICLLYPNNGILSSKVNNSSEKGKYLPLYQRKNVQKDFLHAKAPN